MVADNGSAFMNSSSLVSAKCFVENSGHINCSDIIYGNERAWRKSRHQIDMLIHVLKTKLVELKEIRRHLRENKPKNITYEENFSDEVASWTTSQEDNSDLGKRAKDEKRRMLDVTGKRLHYSTTTDASSVMSISTSTTDSWTTESPIYRFIPKHRNTTPDSNTNHRIHVINGRKHKNTNANISHHHQHGHQHKHSTVSDHHKNLKISSSTIKPSSKSTSPPSSTSTTESISSTSAVSVDDFTTPTESLIDEPSRKSNSIEDKLGRHSLRNHE